MNGFTFEHERRHVSAAERPQAGALTLADLGYYFVLSVPLAAGVSTGRGVEIAGFNYTGWLWLAYLFVGLGLILLGSNVGRSTTFHAVPFLPWAIWFGYVLLSLAWCEDLQRRNVQDCLQITMPFLMGIVGWMFVRTTSQLRQLLKFFVFALPLLAVALVAMRLGLLPGVDLEEGMRPLALTAVLIGGVCLAQTRSGSRLAWLGWVLCVVLVLLSGSRMPLATLVIMPLCMPSSRSSFVSSLLGRCLLVVVLMVAALLLLQTPQMQQRFFQSGEGKVSDVMDGNVDGEGRWDAWPRIWRQAWKHPVFGAGVGTSAEFVPKVWEGMHHVQNDYLRIGFEFGLVGLAIFVVVLLWQLLILASRIGRYQGSLRVAFSAGFLGLIAFAITATTGNPIGYNIWFMNPLFVLLGATFGIAHRASKGETDVASVMDNISVSTLPQR